MDSRLDIARDRYNLWKQEQDEAMRDECERCYEHDENCPFYDPEEETFDYRECFEVRG